MDHRDRTGRPRETQPLDLTYYYLTASMGVGQAMRLATIDRRLGRYPIEPVLDCIGEFDTRLDELSPRDRQQVEAFTRWALPPRTAAQANAVLATSPAALPMSSQTVVNLALRALVHCPSEGRAPDKPTLVRQLGSLVLALGDHLGSEAGSDDGSTTLEVTRLGLFHTKNELGSWLELARRLYLDVMPTLTDDNDFVDVDGLCRSEYEMPIARFWALTVVHGIVARMRGQTIPMQLSSSDWNVTDDELASWLDVWSIPLAEAREAAKRDVQRGTGWSFETFAETPLIRTANRYFAVRPEWLAAKATPAGMFWALRNAYVNSGGQHQRWAQFVGRSVERLGRTLLQEEFPEIDTVSEVEIKGWGPGPNCDEMLVGSSVVGIDFVFRQFTRESAGTGGLSHLEEDFRKAAVEKYMQIDGSLAKGLANGHIAPDAIYAVVVVGGPFPINPLLYETVSRMVAERNPDVVGVDARCRPLAMLDLASYAALLRTANRNCLAVEDVLERWLASGLWRMGFRDWLTTDGSDLLGGEGWGTWSEHALAVLGMRVPEEE